MAESERVSGHYSAADVDLSDLRGGETEVLGECAQHVAGADPGGNQVRRSAHVSRRQQPDAWKVTAVSAHVAHEQRQLLACRVTPIRKSGRTLDFPPLALR